MTGGTRTKEKGNWIEINQKSMTMKLRQKQLISVTVCLSVYIFVVCMLLLNREEKHGHFSKFLFLFSTEDTGLTWEWVNNDIIFDFGELFTFPDFHHISYCCGGRVVSLITHSENHSFFMSQMLSGSFCSSYVVHSWKTWSAGPVSSLGGTWVMS